jgi:hypothetical protein
MINYISALEMIKETVFNASLPIQHETKASLPIQNETKAFLPIQNETKARLDLEVANF